MRQASPKKTVNSLAKKIGRRIFDRRSELELTQAELVKKAKLAHATICMSENGTREPSVTSLKKIAGVLGVSMDYFFE